MTSAGSLLPAAVAHVVISLQLDEQRHNRFRFFFRLWGGGRSLHDDHGWSLRRDGFGVVSKQRFTEEEGRGEVVMPEPLGSSEADGGVWVRCSWRARPEITGEARSHGRLGL